MSIKNVLLQRVLAVIFAFGAVLYLYGSNRVFATTLTPTVYYNCDGWVTENTCNEHRFIGIGFDEQVIPNSSQAYGYDAEGIINGNIQVCGGAHGEFLGCAVNDVFPAKNVLITPSDRIYAYNWVFDAGSSAGDLTDAQFYGSDSSGNPALYAFSGNYWEPTITLVSSAPPDLTDQTVKINLSGNFPVSSAQKLDIQIWSQCSKTGYASYHSATPDAHIIFYSTGSDSCKTETIDMGAGYYYGAGWCYSPLQSSWTATGIKVPFPNGYTCQYPATYNLLTLNGTHYDLTKTGTLTTIGAITSGSGVGQDCTGLDTGAYVACKLKGVFLDLFSFQNIDTSTVQTLSDELKTKVPFAYAMSVFNFNMSAPISSTSMPALSLVFATSSPTFNWTGGGAGIDSAFTTIRTAISVLLWVFLVSYIVVRIRSFSEKL